MANPAPRKEIPVSMRFRDDDLAIIDRGAALTGLSRTEFMRRAAVHEAQTAILNESVIRLSPDCLLYTSPNPRDGLLSRMPSSA